MELLIANAQIGVSLAGSVAASRKMMRASLRVSSVRFRECRGLGFANTSSRLLDSGRGISGCGVGIREWVPWEGSVRRRGLVCRASSVSYSVTESAGDGNGIVDRGRKFHGKSVWSYVIPLRRTFPLIEPFVFAELGLILGGWICTMIAVAALFLTVPRIGMLSNLLAKGDVQQLFPKAGQVLALVMVKSVAQFWQQVLLWEAALKITYKLRAHVYERVLKRDMDYFEGGEGGAATGDVAFRLTAEAKDVSDTVHSLLHVRYLFYLYMFTDL